MAGEVRYDFRRVQLWALVDGVEHPLAAVQLNFGLNAIPQASCQLAVGRSLDTGLPAPIHAQFPALDEQRPLQVWANLTPRLRSDAAVPDLGIPDGDFLLFEGFTSNLASAGQRAGQFGVLLTGNHWLSKLASSSCLSRSSHPSNPASYTAAALLGDLGAGAGAGRSTVLANRADDFFTEPNLVKDMWGESLKPFLVALASTDHFAAEERNLKGSGSNREAKAALARMAGSRYAVPLALDLQGAGGTDLPFAVAESMSDALGNPGQLAHLTFWDVLVGRLAVDYGFAVSPRVSEALVVPFVPGYRGEGGRPYRVIGPDAHDGYQYSRAISRPVRALGLLGSIASRSGDDLTDGDAPSGPDLGIGGYFEGRTDGHFLFQAAPDWLSQLVMPSQYAADATGAAEVPVASALHPRGAKARKGAKPKPRRREAARAVKSVLDRLAQARYVEAALATRNGVLHGPLRLDLAPGSLVKVVTAPEKILGGSDLTALVFYATVVQCTLSIDVNAEQAGTVLYLGHVRGEAGNREDWGSVEKHPLYRRTFAGAPLA